MKQTQKKSGNTRRRVVILLGILIVAVVCLFIPYTPSNAVRLSLAQHAQPLKGLLVYPLKLADAEGQKYSGQSDWDYYHVQYTIGTAKFSTRVIGVHKNSGSVFYTGTPVKD
ncbi:hypothetical protein [Levilactobacillus humaensis]|uniref:hypothetical protein n=1 Tax=Levilactobacillus humaensis TaxID=2950375 RepID=UPI0021C28E04|nr:hypothetical protein [Levilactobacillus humaensis]